MKKFIFLLIILLIFLTACESSLPLYKAYKSYDGFDKADINYIKNNLYSDIGNFESSLKENNGIFIKTDSDLLEKLTSHINNFIDVKFDLGYLNIEKGNFESLMETVDNCNPEFNYKSFINDIKENKVIMSVKKATILPGGYINEYKHINNQIFYILGFSMVINTTAIDNSFFDSYPYYCNGNTSATVYIYCKKEIGDIKIISWQENYKNGETKTSINYVLK